VTSIEESRPGLHTSIHKYFIYLASIDSSRSSTKRERRETEREREREERLRKKESEKETERERTKESERLREREWERDERRELWRNGSCCIKGGKEEKNKRI
jgi:hypothetical protein